MLDDLEYVIRVMCQSGERPRLLLGVSGGPDSLYLLHQLHCLDYPLVVAHMDHGLRPESAKEAEYVTGIVGQLGLTFELGRADVASYAAEKRLSIEEAARDLRYQFLFQAAQKHAMDAVAVGHTADDQVETVLMHLLRGAGLAGLKGMTYYTLPNPWSRDIPLMRPLLGIWREQIDAYLLEHGIQPVLDQSNMDTRFYRNRLRLELIPYLQKYNPQVKQLLWRMATVLGDDYQMLEQVVGDAWGRCLVVQGADFLCLNAPVLRGYPVGMQRNLLRKAMADLRPGLRDIGFDAIQRAIQFMSFPTQSNEMDWIAGVQLYLEGERLWLADWEADLPVINWPQLPQQALFELYIPGQVELPDGWQFTAEYAQDIAMAQNCAQENEDPYQAWLDGDRLQLPLQVRGRHAGERIAPLGMHGHSLKLADLMVNLKIPRRARQQWPLVVSGDVTPDSGAVAPHSGTVAPQSGTIAWVSGFCISHHFRLREQTRRIVYLQLRRTDKRG